jgi:trehalose-6-phosphate synthase
LLVTLPCHADIVRSLCAYDVIGFQTERDLQAFRDYIALEANGKFAPDGTIEAYGRRLKAAAYPIGIDTDNVVRMAQTAARSNTLLRLRQSIGARVLLIGVDRLDYSKGLVERFEAFGRLLRTYPPFCRSRHRRAPTSRSTTISGASSRRPPGTSTASMPSSTGHRYVTSTGAYSGARSPASSGSPRSGW